MMFRVVFWDILPCKIIIDRRFRGAYCLHYQYAPLKRRSTIILHARRQLWTSYSPPWELEISQSTSMICRCWYSAPQCRIDAHVSTDSDHGAASWLEMAAQSAHSRNQFVLKAHWRVFSPKGRLQIVTWLSF
jgi:hypothetical protein